MIFEVVELLDDWNVDVSRCNSPELGIAQSVVSRIWHRFKKMLIPDLGLQSDSRRNLIWRVPGTRYNQENTIARHRYAGAGWLVWEELFLVPELISMFRV
ncbi:uncharacterized protein TNCV_4777461 [Trichonephila clavipes]|nr:uncharacterized protein TNCV_4777461 [Trichonephila clavipes]